MLRSNKKKGVTLAENVIGLLIITLAFGGFLQVCNISNMMLLSAKCRVSAINIAQDELERRSNEDYESLDASAYTDYKSYPNIVIDSGPTSGSGDDITGEMRTYVRAYTEPLTSKKGKLIYVRVLWTQSGQSKEESAETVICPDE